MLPSECHILVLEDEAAILQIVAGALRVKGFTQISMSSSIGGARQCWQAQMGKFNLLLTDFSLPDGCATDFIRDLLRSKPDLRVILMTGYSEDLLGLDSSLRRSVAILQKPFVPRELLETVSAQMQQAEAAHTAI